MSSIKDFKKVENTTTKNTIDPEELHKTKEDYSDLIELFLSKYGQMDEDELIAEMLKLINIKKQQGTYDAEQLKELAGKVTPFLDEQQKQKMESLLKYL